MQTPKLYPAFVLGMILFTALQFGCAMFPLSSKPVVSIGSPVHGASVNMGQEVLVQAIATDASGIARVELWVDGTLVTLSQPPSPQTTHAAILHWTPAAAGAHMLMVKAVNVGGVSGDPSAVTVNVVGQNTSTTPATTAVPPMLATASLAQTPAACGNDAEFVEDVTVPVGSNQAPGQAFSKTWRVRNTGACEWGPGYELVFVGGEAMTTQSTFVVPVTAPGSTADLVVAMTAPTAPGAHAGQWRLRSSSKSLFGATLNVSINVPGAAPTQPPPTQAQQPMQPLPSGCAGMPVIASFDANPAAITAGQSASLSWGKVSNATSAVIDQGIGGIGTPGSTGVSPNKTTIYTLTATGCGGTTTKQVTVTVNSQSNPADLPSITAIVIPNSAIVLKPDLAITDMHLVSTTGPSRLHVGLKNTGNADFNGSFSYKCVVPQVIQRGTNQLVASLGDEGTLSRKIAKGGTDQFNPLGSMTFDATIYFYPQIICVVGLDGDPTPADNQLTITVP